MSDQPGNSYRVVYSEKLHTNLLQLRAKAASVRMPIAFLLDLRAIDEHLKQKPTEWGEPEFQYHELHLRAYCRVQGMLFAHYAVDETRMIVYPFRIEPKPNTPLAPGD